MSISFGQAVVSALREAAEYNRNAMARPVAVLWPDESKEWEEVVHRLAGELPILILGDYEPDMRTGPSIWIRCMLARQLLDADWPEDVVPVVYLPGYSRSNLRAAEECPDALKPIFELQYRGVIWSQANGRDWTLPAFIQSCHGGLGISIGADTETRSALRRAAGELVDEPLEALKTNEPLRARYFNSLLTPDLTRLLLQWMNDPSRVRSRMEDHEWGAFRSNCKAQLYLDPDEDGEITAARRLGERVGDWADVWARFAEAPRRYPKIPSLLRAAAPEAETLFDHAAKESWPQHNDSEEEVLRNSLMSLSSKRTEDVRDEIQRLEEVHGLRRHWVWAELGQSPLANALQYLSQVAQETSRSPIAGPVDALIQDYFQQGWKIDAAAVDALACVSTVDDWRAVSAVLDLLYKPWLRDTAERFQDSWIENPPDVHGPRKQPEPGVVYVFVDGLRMDIGFRLKEKLENQHFACTIQPRIAALPSITETAKPAVSPVAGELCAGPELSPTTKEGTVVDARVLRHVLSESDFEVLQGDETGNPDSCGWVECGRLDQIGHVEGWRFAHRIDDELRLVCERVSQLLLAGWQEVLIVTDHGWLLLPSELPSYKLYERLTTVRMGRCARLKPDAEAQDVIVVPWFWDRFVVIAVPRGIKSFIAGKQYDHGGITPQEIVVPELIVRGGDRAPEVRVDEVSWVRLRCRVRLAGDASGMMVDLRMRPAEPDSSIAESAKEVPEDLTVSLVCPHDSLEGDPVAIVVYRDDEPGRILAQSATLVGGGDR